MTEERSAAPEAGETPAAKDEAAAATAAPATPPSQRPARTGRSALFLLWLLLLALLGGSGAWLWRYHENTMTRLGQQDAALAQLASSIESMRATVTGVEARQGDIAAIAQRNSVEIANFEQRIEEQDEVLGQLQEQLAGGGARFQLAAVEQLLLLANDRVHLARDPRSAAVALQAADERLAALADPRLFKLREAIAEEREALLAVPVPDQTAAALTLASLIDRVPRLPLAARVPEHFEPDAPETEDAEPAGDWWSRLKASVMSALKGTFSVRRVSGPTPRLLPPEQESLAYQLLELKLEGARVALLRNDTASFRAQIEAAADWLREQFRREDPGVMAALAELERLQSLDLSPPLPDISRSLVLLRAALEPAPQ